MEYVRISSTGMRVSRICLGCMTYGAPAWRERVLDERASRPFFKRAIKLGITFFDTANMYSLLRRPRAGADPVEPAGLRLIGASRLYQREQAVAALDVALDAEEIAALEAPYTPHSVRGHS